jgi:protochlorophyllide reductase
VLITGGSSGVGMQAAKIMADKGADVIVTARKLERANAAANDIHESAFGYALDLSDMASVRTFAFDIQSALKGRQLDVLVLNAGMVYGPEFEVP